MDLGVSYEALTDSYEEYNELFLQCEEVNVSITTPELVEIKSTFPELNLSVR